MPLLRTLAYHQFNFEIVRKNLNVNRKELEMPRIVKQKSYTEYKTAKPKTTPYKLSDGNGLTLLVRPSGQKVWQYHYTFDGKRQTITVGYFDTMNPKEARNLRDELRANMLKGIPPKTRQRFS